MSFANVNVGTSNSDNTGDSLRAAFQKINQNFAEITAGNIDITVESAVTSVAGKTGDVVLYASDINGLTVAAVSEAASRGYVDTSRAQAEATSRAYTDIKIGQAVSGILDSAPGALDTLNELAAALGDDANFAATITNRIAIVEDNLETIRLESSGSLSVAIDNLGEDIDGEVTRATAAEASLASDIAGLRTDLDSEVEDRTIADSTLQSNLDSAVADLQAADANIETLLNTEISNRGTAVNTVQSNLDAETQARIDADTDLQSQINNIVSNIDPAALDSLTEIVAAFQTADENLDTAITTLAGTASTNLANGLALKANIADLADVATSGAYSDLSGTPTAVSAFTNDAGYITGIDFADVDNKPTTVSGYGITDAFDGQYSSLDGAPVLANVATSGNYNDLSNKPTIPSLDGLATETYVGIEINAAIDNLVNSAPGTLDTLNELAAALGDDANFSTTITNLVANVQANVDTISDALDTKANATDLANATDWNTAVGWGDHSQAGYVKSVGGELPDANGDVTVSKDSVVDALQYAPVSSVNGVVPSPSTGALVLDLADLTDATNLIPTVPTVVSQLDNDAGYLTADDIAVNTGNFTFSSNTLGVSDTDGGITINANGNGEIVLSDNVGIQNNNPGYMLHVGTQIDINQTGSIGIAYGDVNTIAGVATDSGFTAHQMGGEVSLTWDWYASVDGTPKGSYNGNTTNHARFGIFKNGSLSTPWLTFDRDAPANVLAVDAQGRLVVTNGVGIDTEASGTSYSDTNFKIFDPWGALFVTSKDMVSANTASTGTSITDVGHSFFTEATLTENLTRYDRIRGFSSSLDIIMSGQTWDAWSKFPTVAGFTSSVKAVGDGRISQVIGNAAYAIVNPTTGTLDVTDPEDIIESDPGYLEDSGLAVGVIGGAQLIVTDTSGSASTVDVAAGLSVGIFIDNSATNDGSGNYQSSATATNAVGLYLPYRGGTSNSWARTGGNATITNRFSIHSEDPNAILRNYGNIETNGAIVFNSGAVTFTGDISDLTDNEDLLTPSLTSFEIDATTVSTTGLVGADTIVIKPAAGYSGSDTQSLAFTGRNVVNKRTLIINTSSLCTINFDFDDMMAPLTVTPSTVTEVIYVGNSEWFIVSERAM